MNSFLQQDFQRFFIKDFIINCNKTNYLEHYENLNYKTIGQQIYRNREQWVGNFDDRLIHHIQIPNSEEVKTFNLYESSNNPSQKSIHLEFKSENLIFPEKSYKIDLELNQKCLF